MSELKGLNTALQTEVQRLQRQLNEAHAQLTQLYSSTDERMIDKQVTERQCAGPVGSLLASRTRTAEKQANKKENKRKSKKEGEKERN